MGLIGLPQLGRAEPAKNRRFSTVFGPTWPELPNEMTADHQSARSAKSGMALQTGADGAGLCRYSDAIDAAGAGYDAANSAGGCCSKMRRGCHGPGRSCPRGIRTTWFVCVFKGIAAPGLLNLVYLNYASTSPKKQAISAPAARRRIIKGTSRSEVGQAHAPASSALPPSPGGPGGKRIIRAAGARPRACRA